ncbi:ATP-binding protein [Psychrobacter piscatorii]|uniref:histidine kinase n=1 Tax=Psychrobacter piscatorii TaxID=554343 RepID=A0A0T6DU58_9GAMM|nr:histidine kinase [Psychrobacter piscatorii]
MKYRFDNRRLPLLWRTVLLLTIFVVISQVIIYIWIQRSVKGHFEQMDAEIMTHAAFNLRKRVIEPSSPITSQTLPSSQYPLNSQQPLRAAPDVMRDGDTSTAVISEEADHQHSSWLDYDLKTIIANKEGQILSSTPNNFAQELGERFNLSSLKQDNDKQQFVMNINSRYYRAMVIEDDKMLALIALPIDVHHQYLLQFNRQLSMILFAITLLLVSVAALSVYWGFAPLATIVQKMKTMNPDRLDDRVTVSDMPLELRPLAESYNSMMAKLESNFESLSRFSDNIAHELRTPIATLSTQTQVMLNKPRAGDEYIEQLHHQHDTLEQLSAMINNMLLLAKTQKGLSDSQISHVDTDSLITKLVDYYEMLAEDREITFEKSGEFVTVLGDEGLLQRLFANLLSNAIYYAASASTITVSATIITSGIGLDGSKEEALAAKQRLLKIVLTNRLDKPLEQSEAEKLFERFYRHDKTSSQHLGTGLGLSIVRAIAHAHKGKVNIAIKDEYYFEVTVELLMA